jgi:ribosomal protein S18 acetylase RimI-like enzyme
LVRRALKLAADEGLSTASVHVQVDNDDALAFYESLGFVQVRVIPRYYPPRVQPRDCVLMEHSTTAT